MFRECFQSQLFSPVRLFANYRGALFFSDFQALLLSIVVLQCCSSLLFIVFVVIHRYQAGGMIRHLSIDDFAVIKNTEIDFEDGLNVITGETGAGKSIVIEAMSLALGDRADSSLVRHGAKRARIQLLAEISGEELSVTREISENGRNLCRLNGNVTPLSVLREETSPLADIHGQYDNQMLLNPDNHLPLVDSFGRTGTGPAKAAFADAYEKYKSARGELNELIREENETRRLSDLYRYEADEIENAGLRPGEDEELSERVKILQNSEKVAAAASSCRSLLSDPETGALDRLGEARTILESVRSVSRELEDWTERLESLCLELEDISSGIDRLAFDSSYDPGELDRVIGRLSEIDRLKKKYGGKIEDILARGVKTRALLDRSDVFAAQKAELERKSGEALELLKKRADELSGKRIESASVLSRAVERELKELNFTGARFSAEIKRAPAITKSGRDICEFMISTNPGEPLKPLAKSASGGEISRVMLAIKAVTFNDGGPETLIFDEIDQGISGITASVVARKLRRIASGRQVICITHLPQIAAAADHSYRIYKDSDGSAACTHIEELDEDEKVSEIARLLGGDTVTGTTISSARELIEMTRGRG